MAEIFPYDEELRQKCEDYIWELYNANEKLDLGLTYRLIGQKVDEKYNIDWYKYDSERVRNAKRKFERFDVENKAEAIINKLDETKENRAKIRIDNKNIMVIDDLHIPFSRKDVLDEIRKHADKIKAIVFGGDILDCFEISSFPSINRYPIEEELIKGIEFFKEVKSVVPSYVKLILIHGNHEKRLKTYIAKSQQKQMLKFLDPNILTMLRDGFTVHENGEKNTYIGVKDLIVINNWYVNVNNEVIVCHPYNFYREEIKNAKQAIEYFVTMGEKFSTVIVAHNHKQGETSNHLGKYGIVSGCMCQTFEYTEGRTNVRPQDYGYVVVGFDNDGKVDKNTTRVYKLEEEEYKKENYKVEIDL